MTTKKRFISVSIMCADLMKLGESLSELERNGIDYIHVDVMDAHFVPNLTFGPDFAKAMRHATSIPLDIHLMMDDPLMMIPLLDLKQGEILSVHAELDLDFKSLSERIHSYGAKFGLVVNPETPVSILEPHLSVIDTVTLMLVKPGFAGGTMLDGIMNKVAETRQFLDERGYSSILISVDGSVSHERANLMAKMGANIFVGGTAGVYRKGYNVGDSIQAFQKAIS